MKLSDKYKYTVLCEDRQSYYFIQAFLVNQGIKIRDICPIIAPAGDICGEQYVKKYYPSEFITLLKTKYLKRTLFVCTDADIYSVEKRKNDLKNQYKHDFAGDKKHSKALPEEEPVVFVIPKRNIETWIHFFRGEEVDEIMDFRHSGNPVKCKNEAQKMSDYFVTGDDEGRTMLPSIIAAKEEYDRVCEMQDR